MSRPRNPWIMLHRCIIDSPDIRFMTEAQRWSWICLLLMADQNGEIGGGWWQDNGKLLATYLGVGTKILRSCIELTTEKGMTCWKDEKSWGILVINNYHKYQRVRDNKPEKPVDNDTQLNTDKNRYIETNSDIDTNTDTKIENKTGDAPEPPLQVLSEKPKRSKKEKQPDIPKDKYLDFVYLSKEEYEKLVNKFGKENADQRIENLNIGIGSKGYKYDSHYFTILSWARKEEKDGKSGFLRHITENKRADNPNKDWKTDADIYCGDE